MRRFALVARLLVLAASVAVWIVTAGMILGNLAAWWWLEAPQ